MFSSTARVCSFMSKCIVPISSILCTPAKVLSGKRELVPLMNIKSPTRFTCGYAPRGVAFPSTNLLLLLILLLFCHTERSRSVFKLQFQSGFDCAHPDILFILNFRPLHHREEWLRFLFLLVPVFLLKSFLQ